MFVTMIVREYKTIDGDFEAHKLEGFGDNKDEAIEDAWREFTSEQIRNSAIVSKWFLN